MDTQLAITRIHHHAWALMVQNQINSGLSVREWCTQNHVSTKTFYYRRKQIRGEVLEAASPCFAEITPITANTPASSESRFIPQFTVSISDVTIGIDGNTPKELLLSVLEVIRHA